MFGIPYARQDWIDAEVAKAAARDPFGHRLHLILGLTWLVLVPGPMSVVEFAGAGLWGACVLRAYYIHRTWRSFGCHPMLWMIAAFVAWQWLSMTWSPSPKLGWGEIIQNRWVWAMWMTWCILPLRGAMIAALAAGFLAANAAQVLHGVGLAFDIPSITFNRHPDRNPGWWQPVVAGSMLTAALGLHLPAAVMGSGRMRWVATACAAATLAGVIATGSRGAWLASGALVVIVLAVAALRWWRTSGTPVQGSHENPPRSGRRMVLTGLILAAAVGVVWLGAGKQISRRYENAREEVRKVIEHRDYTTWIGARVLMAKFAWMELRTDPLRGVGAGGFKTWADAHRDPNEPGYIYPHAHNTYLHIAATTGVVGLGLYLAVMGMGLYGAFKGMGTKMGTYAAGPGFALIGLLLVGMTDVIELNAQTAALSCVLLGLCMRPRPGETGLPPWKKAAWGKPFPR